ncbi:MAG TPA: Holliday junction resolvase RuvX [Candidatus Peribacteraceae bacterium]|nr:Holliday junction resolvase RuvX [Candidatus Peribacteraceae bacterium]
MRTLGLDIGERRTGVAFNDSAINIPFPLDTITADSKEEMIAQVELIARERKVDRIVVGLPLLPSGDEGSQAHYVRSCAANLEQLGFPIDFLDERYTTVDSKEYDGDARAACQLLQTYHRL